MIPAHLRVIIRRKLLAWFARHARDLPWRRNRDPYAIWISEVMLQQTQVVTVVPYFQRFLQHYPSLADLARAGEPEVLCLWEGLGYYRRARHLLEAARLLHAAGASIPDDPDLLATMPGLGRYTINAILSQAYNRRLPIVEANSRRVLCRLFAIEQDPRLPAVQEQLWQLAEELLPRKSVGQFNQAVMELGALVCTPAAPSCASCPVASICQARLQNRQLAIPVRAKSVDVSAVDEVAVVVRRRDRILLVQRPAHGRWANLWECPHHPRAPAETTMAAAERLLGILGIEGHITRELTTIRHSVTRYRIAMTCLEARFRRGTLSSGLYPAAVWASPEEWEKYPLSAPQRRLIESLGK